MLLFVFYGYIYNIVNEMRKIMDTLDKSSRDYEICLCKKLNRGYVEDLIKEKNIKTLKELCEVGDIGNVCGGCREDLDMVLEEILNGEV